MDYQIFSIETEKQIFSGYAQHTGRPLILVDRVGINNSEDQEAIDRAFAFYEKIMAPEIFSTLKVNKMFSILFHSNDYAVEYASDNFPDRDEKLAFPELKIIVTVMDAEGHTRYTNAS